MHWLFVQILLLLLTQLHGTNTSCVMQKCDLEQKTCTVASAQKNFVKTLSSLYGAQNTLLSRTFVFNKEVKFALLRENYKILFELTSLTEEYGRNIIDYLKILNQTQTTPKNPNLLRSETVLKFLSSKLPKNCDEAIEYGKKSGVYKLQIPEFSEKTFFVYCLIDKEGGKPWALVLRRHPHKGQDDHNFNQNHHQYRKGFGDVTGSSFIGLDVLHWMTNVDICELWVNIKDFKGNTSYAKYRGFAIGDEKEDYAIKLLGEYSGTAGDVLRENDGGKFSTIDYDVDQVSLNCANKFSGGWWYQNHKLKNHHCGVSVLTGPYPMTGTKTGIHWGPKWTHLYYAHMAIRPITRN